MMTRRSVLKALAALPLSGRSGRALSPTWAWVGHLTASGATIKASATPGGRLRLRLAAESGVTPAHAEQAATVDAFGVAAFRIEGLTPQSRYRFVVDDLAGGELSGTFRTFPSGPGSFRIAFASCARTGSSSSVFDAIRSLQPDLFVHLGDLHYEDIGRNDEAAFGRAYSAALSAPGQALFFRNVPVAYTWDDHDFGPNDSDRTSKSRLAALAAYRRFVPHYPLMEGEDAPICQAFWMGRARVILTDARSARSPRRLPPDARTMLGARQVEWLERQFADGADAPLVIWANTVPWVTQRDESSADGWAPYARERRRLANTIQRLGLTNRMVMLCGDAHMLALDDGGHSQYAEGAPPGASGFVVAHAAPLDQNASAKGGPYTAGPWRGTGQFGVLDVEDDGQRCRVTIRGFRRFTQVPGMMLVREFPYVPAR
jgi:phosphodiesterase/alkaline phosphatase D-like protein